jgi:hypothetical protein
MAFTRFAIGASDCDCNCGPPPTCDATIDVDGCSGALPGATVSITGVGSTTTNGSGVATIAIPSAGTYSGSVSYPGMTTVSFSHTFACPGTALNITMAVADGFGCCDGFPLPLPLTLFSSVCGAMITMPATMSGGFIGGWVGSGTVTTGNVAVFPTDPCEVNSWDGLTTTTGSVNITLTITCGGGGGAPPFLSEVVLGGAVNESPNFNVAFCSDSDEGLGCCGGVTLQYDDLCSVTSSALAGTWGPVVSASGALGTFFNEHSAANNCGSNGLTCGTIEVSS